MSGPVLGIDLGTTNSAVAVADGRESRVLADEDGRRLIPSVVSFHPDGSILVGHDARERRLVDARNTVYSIKRLIGRPFQSSEVQRAKERVAFDLEATPVGGVQVRVRRGTFALPEISAMVLRHLRSVAETALGEPCQRAVITVPANFNELQRSATQAAGKVAGLDVMRILNEPTAATLAYGYAREKAETIAVYDLGGGTFDLTILDLDKDVFEVVSTAGDTFLGGDDIDVLIADRMATQCLKDHRYDPKQDPQTFERLRAAGEWTKCQLSGVHEVDVTIEELLHDVNGRAVHFHFRMTRLELEELARPLISRSFDVVNDALRSAGRRPKEIKSVVLVGGSTRMPIVRRMVTEFFHREPQADIDPDLVVAQGAAIHAYTLSGEKRASARPAPAPTKPVARVALKRAGAESPGVEARPPAPARKQPAFAPEDPRDIAPRIEEATRIAPAPTRRNTDDRPARRVGSDSDMPPPSRSNTSPYGIAPAGAAAESPSSPGLEIDLELDEPTRIGAYPKEPAKAELSPPFVEPSSSVAVVQTRAVGIGAPAQPAPVRAPADPSLLALDEPAEAAPPPRKAPPPREPTIQIATGPKPKPVVAAPSLEAPVRQPTPDVPVRKPAPEPRPSTLSLEANDLAPASRPPPPERHAPPVPPPRAPDRDKIHAALFGGKPKPAFADALPLPPDPGPLQGLPEPASIPATTPSAGFGFPMGAPQVSPQALSPRQPSVAMPDRPAPLLMDVTPLALGLETAGGYVQHLVNRNAPIPTEKTRVFSTARDDQTEVEVRICQGDSNVYKDNQALGAITLTALRKARRGEIRIEVTFMIDASGILDVKATDLDTRHVQALRVALRGGIDQAEVDQMRQRQERELFPAQR
jgi:molecular chaperone DnaK